MQLDVWITLCMCVQTTDTTPAAHTPHPNLSEHFQTVNSLIFLWYINNDTQDAPENPQWKEHVISRTKASFVSICCANRVVYCIKLKLSEKKQQQAEAPFVMGHN